MSWGLLLQAAHLLHQRAARHLAALAGGGPPSTAPYFECRGCAVAQRIFGPAELPFGATSSLEAGVTAAGQLAAGDASVRASRGSGDGMPSVLHAQRPAGASKFASPVATPAASSPEPSDSQPPATGTARPRPAKSARRTAAEALLASRFGGGVNGGCANSGCADGGRGGGSAAAARGGGKARLKTAWLFELAGSGGGGATALAAALGRGSRGALKPLGVGAAREASTLQAVGTPPAAAVVAAPPAPGEAAAPASAAPGPGAAAPAAAAVGEAVVVVAACDDTCVHPEAHGWCHMPVRVPHADWAAIMAADPESFSSYRVAPGYERLQLPHGLQVLVVENPLYLPDAVRRLRASMDDPVLAIDLEWRPQFGARPTPVAMLQLASARTALLVRTCRMQYRLAPELAALLGDPAIAVVGFSWAHADEGKMVSTFGVGAGAFPRFVDLQAVARGLGWHNYGLARLAQAVLGSPMPKSKRVSMSNWESRVLTRQQVKYAALDVFIAGQVFRGLRLWHRSPSPCPSCLQPLGAVQPPAALVCREPGCGRDFGPSVAAHLAHCRSTGHVPAVEECAACGCLRPAAVTAAGKAGDGDWAASTSAATAAAEADGAQQAGEQQVQVATEPPLHECEAAGSEVARAGAPVEAAACQQAGPAGQQGGTSARPPSLQQQQQQQQQHRRWQQHQQQEAEGVPPQHKAGPAAAIDALETVGVSVAAEPQKQRRRQAQQPRPGKAAEEARGDELGTAAAVATCGEAPPADGASARPADSDVRGKQPATKRRKTTS